MTLTVILALGAAMSNATASVLEKQGAKKTSPDEALRLSLVIDLARRPAWLAGIGAMTASFGFQAAALSQGQLSVVQPIVALELLFVLAILVVGFHRRVGRWEWLGAAGIVVGVGGFLFVAAPSGGRTTASPLAWSLTALAALVAVAITVVVGSVSGGSRRAAAFGLGGAIAFAMTAALIKTSVAALSLNGTAALFTSWRPYAVAVAGAAAVYLSAVAFQRGSVAAAQAALSAADPLISVAIGVALFDEHIRSQPTAIGLEVAGLALLAAGITALSHSRLVQQTTPDAKENVEKLA